MDRKVVLVKKRENIAQIILNNPKERNMLSEQMLSELVSAFEELRNDDSIRVITTTGAGNNTFASGMRLHDLKRYYEHPETEVESSWPQLSTIIRSHPKVTIAVVNGYALGGGLSLVLAHDLAIASEEKAEFGLPEAIRGFTPKYLLGALVHAVPLKVAFDLTLSGDNWNAGRAQAAGLVTRLAPHSELQEAAFRWAKQIARWDPMTLEYCKKALHAGKDEPTLAQALRASAYYHEQNLKYNPLHHKGLDKFIAKQGIKAILKADLD